MMDFIDIQDISFIDIDELGVRPGNWTDDGNDNEFEQNANGYFVGKEKNIDLQLINSGKKITTDEITNSMLDDGDDSNYEIDPETGEKIFGEGPVASSPSLSPTNNKWIEEYLSNIESSSSTTTTTTSQQIPLSTSTTSDLLFDDIQFNNDQTDFSWFDRYISTDESPKNIMFADHEKSFLQTTSPIYIPLSNHTPPGSLMNLFSVSHDDHYSISSNSNSSRGQRLFSTTLESDSTTRDSDTTYDGSLIETKLEKIEHDEHSMSHSFVRRSSTRAIYQGQQDEETLLRYNIPLRLDDITQSTTDEYNRHLARLNHLSPEQIHVIKDIRRRGKNKIAAQNCRKRKAVGVESLLEEVDELKRIKHDLEERRKAYQQQIAETRHQYECLHRQVLPNRQIPPSIIVK